MLVTPTSFVTPFRPCLLAELHIFNHLRIPALTSVPLGEEIPERDTEAGKLNVRSCSFISRTLTVSVAVELRPSKVTVSPPSRTTTSSRCWGDVSKSRAAVVVMTPVDALEKQIEKEKELNISCWGRRWFSW